MLTKEYLQKVYDYLDEKWTKYCTCPRERNQIEEIVQLYSQNLNDELYLTLNEGRATGLFEHGFFERDMQNSFSKITELLNTGNDAIEKQTIL